MANVFVSLPVPVSIGPGLPVDVSGLLGDKSIVVDAPGNEGVISIEGSQDSVNYAPLITLSLINNPTSSSLHAVVAKLRVRRVSGPAPLSVTIGGETTGANLFATLPLPSALGPGPIIDTSAMGPDKTIIVSDGSYRIVAVEGSNDGIEFNPIVSFNTGGADSQSFIGVYSKMRALLSAVKATGSLPTITVGAGPFTGSGTGSQGAQGAAGAQGTSGAQGFQGGIGAGPQGFQGTQGIQGNQGAPGGSGAQGAQGAQGPTGNISPMGPTGFQGAQGTSSISSIFQLLKFSGTVAGDVGAVQQPISDTAVLNTAATLATFNSFPDLASFSTFQLRVIASVNTLTASCTVTLYNSGVASTLSVTIPAGSTAPVTFTAPGPAPSTFSVLVVDIPAGQAGNTITVGAIIETP